MGPIPNKLSGLWRRDFNFRWEAAGKGLVDPLFSEILWFINDWSKLLKFFLIKTAKGSSKSWYLTVWTIHHLPYEFDYDNQWPTRPYPIHFICFIFFTLPGLPGIVLHLSSPMSGWAEAWRLDAEHTSHSEHWVGWGLLLLVALRKWTRIPWCFRTDHQIELAQTEPGPAAKTYNPIKRLRLTNTKSWNSQCIHGYKHKIAVLTNILIGRMFYFKKHFRWKQHLI